MKNVQQQIWFALHFVLLYLSLVLSMTLAKPLFVLAQSADTRQGMHTTDVLQIMQHGLPLDLATTGYLVAPVWLLLGIAIWSRRIVAWRKCFKAYAMVLATLLALVYVGDACLYDFWHTKLDATVWGYLAQPQGMVQSVSMGYALGAVIAVIAVGLALYYLMTLSFVGKRTKAMCCSVTTTCKQRIGFTALWAVAGACLFLGIRGGVGKSTANVGMVYYSTNTFYNHAAVNPAFSLLSSTLKHHDYGHEAHYFNESERSRQFAMLGYNTQSVDTESLLTTTRPNVLIIIMEGCGAEFVNAVNPSAPAQLTPHLNSLAREGVVFTQVYANSFRTDRGTISTLSGCPAYPDLSVMKIPALCERQPSIARTLKAAGYSTSFLYGGDINFTNTHGYLQSTGYDHISGDEAFPASVRHTHNWGVTDRITFDTLYHRIVQKPVDTQAQPWHIGFLTLASHEPWGVPYHRIQGDEVANSMAYLDDCVGRFVQRLRQTPQWHNTLIVLLPDHGINYGTYRDDADPRKSHIPLIMTGGAIKQPRRINLLCNQSDLAATLLGQMGLPHADFKMSRDVLSRTYTRPSAVHVWQEGLWYMDHSGHSVLNVLKRDDEVVQRATHMSASELRRTNAAKAVLQTSYMYLNRK